MTLSRVLKTAAALALLCAAQAQAALQVGDAAPAFTRPQPWQASLLRSTWLPR